MTGILREERTRRHRERESEDRGRDGSDAATS